MMGSKARNGDFRWKAGDGEANENQKTGQGTSAEPNKTTKAQATPSNEYSSNNGHLRIGTAQNEKKGGQNEGGAASY